MIHPICHLLTFTLVKHCVGKHLQVIKKAIHGTLSNAINLSLALKSSLLCRSISIWSGLMCKFTAHQFKLQRRYHLKCIYLTKYRPAIKSHHFQKQQLKCQVILFCKLVQRHKHPNKCLYSTMGTSLILRLGCSSK